MHAAPRSLLAGALALALCVAHPVGARPAVTTRTLAPARPFGIAVRDSLRRIDGNRINMWVRNDGLFAWNLPSGNSGLIWPKGTSQTAVFASGLWLGARVGGGIRATVAEYSSEYGPGPMLGGTFDEPSRPQHRVYKVARWTGNPADSARVTRSANELAADPNLDPLAHDSWSDYIAGAAPYGAPTRLYRLPATTTPDPTDSVDVLGPDVAGDQMLWAIFNDADPNLHTNNAGGTAPLGVEVQQTMFAFNQPEDLRNTVFLRFLLINKGLNSLDSMFVSLWSDPDLGGFTDDFVGCDTTRASGFCYNADASDAVYGVPPPALGYVLLRGAVERATGDTLGLTAFSMYIGGTDPASSDEVYNYMRGLLGNGSALVDPTTSQTTRYSRPGDPVTGTGWLDAYPADRRMMLSSGPFQMAPGDTQEVVAAITVGRGGDNLSSVGVVRCQTDIARALYLRGFASPGPAPAAPCSTNAGYTSTSCPRSGSFWSAECAFGGALLTGAQLAEIAACVDSFSTLFDWATGTDLTEFCALVDPPGALDLRQQAKREYTVLMANHCAGLLRQITTAGEPIWLNRLTGLACFAPRARTIGELTQAAKMLPEFLDAVYANDNLANRRALEGIDVGLPAFGGGAGPAAYFLGSSLDPVADALLFTGAEIRFDRAVTQRAYRYLRLEKQSDGTAPPQGRGYLYAGFVTVPFTCWGTDDGIQIDAAFVERVLTDDTGTILDPAAQPATFDSTWAPDTSATGGHEYLFALRRLYLANPKTEFEQDGILADGSAPVMYALASRLRATFDIIDDGDSFRFLWGRPALPSADSMLVALEDRPLSDPSVQVAYRDLIACLEPINAGIGIGAACTGTTAEAISVAGVEADPARVVVTWISLTTPLAGAVERRFEGGAWIAVGQLARLPDGLIIFSDTDVVAGGRYDYRLAVDIGGRVAYFGQVQVDVPGRSALAFLGARPNPVTQDLVLSFSLATREPARLELLDITGRRVLARDLVGLGAGPQVLDLGSSTGFRAGIYLIRITQGGRRITGKAVIVH
jgi:hypothetical protein